MSTSARDVYDVMVVGAGMIGSAAARYASANQALRVCVVGPAEPSQVSLHVMCKMSAMRVHVRTYVAFISISVDDRHTG